MCLTSREELKAPINVDGFKVFAKENGKLYSPFKAAHAYNFKRDASGILRGSIELLPSFAVNEIVDVNPECNSFFSFEKFEDACRIANNSKLWNVISRMLVVRPVTAINVIAVGKFHVPSEDIQCMDGYYSSFESKKLIVHDTAEIEHMINTKLLRKCITGRNLSYMEQVAFDFFFTKKK